MARRWTAAATAALIALLASTAHAQVPRTNTTCQATYSWMKNAQGQDPCLLASYLSMPCSGAQGTWNSQPLTSTQYYLSPSGANANPCICSAVFYSVVSACAYCQGAVVSTWFQWTPNCTTFASETYPVTIAAGSSLPGWASLPVPPSGAWDATAAYNYAQSSSASFTLGGSSTPAASATNSGSSSTVAIHIPGTSGTTSPAPTETKSSNSGAVIGGAVGGTIGGLGLLAGIGFLVWFYCFRDPNNRQNDRPISGAFDDESKLHNPPVQVQPWNPDPSTQAAFYPNSNPSTNNPMSPSNVSYATQYPTQQPGFSGPGSEAGGPTVYSESNSGYGGTAPSAVYSVANPTSNTYGGYDPNAVYTSNSSAYNPNAAYNHPQGAYQQQPIQQQQQQAAPNLLEGFNGDMHAPPPSYDNAAPGSSMGATPATGYPTEKR